MKYFDYPYRVRYGDTDKMGVTYYARYFEWFEEARTEYFRTLGLPYTECEKQGILLPVVETKAIYHVPSTYDDLVFVRVSVSEMTKASIRFEYEIQNKETGKVIATGYSVHVFVDRSMKPTRVPDQIKNKVSLFKLLADTKA